MADLKGDFNGGKNGLTAEDSSSLEDDKHQVKQTADVEPASDMDAPKRELLRGAPPIIQQMSVEERRDLETKLVRRIDLRLLPMLVLMYIMNYLDRNNIAAARIAGKVGLQDGLHMNDEQYEVSWHCPLVL